MCNHFIRHPAVPCDIIDSTAPTLTFEGRGFPVAPETWNFGPATLGSTDCIAGLGVFDLGRFLLRCAAPI